MLGFKRRRNIDPRATLAHLIPVATNAALDGSDEAMQRGADHLVADLGGLSRASLTQVAALCIMAEGDAQAARVGQFAQRMMADLQAHLDAEGPETAAERPERGPEAQDPLEDDSEPETAAQGPEDEVPAAGWAEDRT